MKHPYKLSPFQKKCEVASDLADLNTKWQELLCKKNVLKEEKFLKSFANLIIALNRHAEELEELGTWKEGAHLIHHVLTTPIGAPFVSDSTLLEASQLYPDEVSETSHLYLLLEQFYIYGHSLGKLPFFEVFKLLSSDLRDAA